MGVPSLACLPSLSCSYLWGRVPITLPHRMLYLHPTGSRTAHRGHRFFLFLSSGALYLPYFPSMPNRLNTSYSVLIPLWVFHQRPHSVSIPVTASLSAYQAALKAQRVAFWVVGSSFQDLNSNQIQQPWTRNDFQPRATCLCVCVCDSEIERQGSPEGCMTLGCFSLFPLNGLSLTLAVLSPVCFSV